MKKVLSIIMVMLATCMFAQQLPNHTGNVTDYSALFSPAEVTNLHNKLTQYEDQTSIEIAVATVNSLEGLDVDNYATNLFNQWGIGRKELDNGLLILLCPTERKWCIRVGNGLEEWITDSYAKQKGESILRPQLKAKKYYAGVDGLIDNFISTLGPEAWKQREALKKERARQAEISAQETKDTMLNIFVFVLLAGTIIGLLIIAYRRKIAKEEAIRKEKARVEQLRLMEEMRIKKEKENAEKAMARLNSGMISLMSRLKLADAEKTINTVSEMQYLQTQMQQINVIGAYTDKLKIVAEADALFVQATEKTKKVLSDYDYLITSRSQIAASKSAIKSRRENTNVVNEHALAATKLFGETIWGHTKIDRTDFLFKQQDLIHRAEQKIIEASMFLEEGNFVSSKNSLKEYQTLYNKLGENIELMTLFCDETHRYSDFVKTNYNKIDSVISQAAKESKHADVNPATKRNFENFSAQVSDIKNKNILSLDPHSAYAILSPFVISMNKVITAIDGDIRNAEEDRKREIARKKRLKEEEEEKERRRLRDIADRERRRREEEEESSRRSSYSSSYSSYDSSSSSSSDSGSSFGGGESSGGGAIGDW